MVETRWHFRLPQRVIGTAEASALKGEVRCPDRTELQSRTEALIRDSEPSFEKNPEYTSHFGLCLDVDTIGLPDCL